MTIRKNKILFTWIYELPNLSETDFTTSFETIISRLSNIYEILILMRDFDMTTNNPILSQFLYTFAPSPLNIDPNYFKNSKNSSCIDLLLTNFKIKFYENKGF